MNEAEVTYLLVEVRKLQKKDESLQKLFPTLSFYCDWAIHTELHWAGAKAFLGKVNPILTLNAVMTDEEHRAVDALFTLRSFRSELRALLQSIGADSAICDDDDRWRGFVHTYSHVVQDSLLIVAGDSVPAGLSTWQ